MTTSITSLNAYYGEVKDTVSNRQAKILEVLNQYPDLSNSELAQILNWSINRVTPRVLELRDLKKVEFSKLRRCRVTGREVKTWKSVRDLPGEVINELFERI